MIFAGILVWAIATIGSALSTSYAMLLFFRALVGVGEGAYGPSANTLLCADAPPEKRGRALGIYNVGMAVGGTGRPRAGRAPGAAYRLARGRSGSRAARRCCWRWPSAFIAAPARLPRPVSPARARVPALADVHPGAGGRHPGDVRRERPHLLGRAS